MSVKLYILRHGVPLFPDSVKRYIGRTDLPLSPEGIAQAEQAALRLAGTGIGAVYSSPLRRCGRFAEIIAGRLGLPPPAEVPALAEIDMGSWEYRPVQEIQTACPDAYTARGLDLAGFTPEGGESFRQCQIRAVKALSAIAAACVGAACVITHAGLIRSFLCYAEGRGLEGLFSYQVPYAGMVTVTYEGGFFRSFAS